MMTKIVYTTIGIAVIAASALQLGNLLGPLLPAHQTTAIQSASMHSAQTSSSAAVKQASVSSMPEAQSALAGQGDGFAPERIIIDTIQLDLPVVAMPLTNGTWEVADGVANYAEGTSLINFNNGNVGLYGHDRANAFTRIKELHQGDTVIVKGNNATATYQVISSTVVMPDDVTVFYPTDDPELTLITCDGLFSDKRYMVRAKLFTII